MRALELVADPGRGQWDALVDGLGHGEQVRGDRAHVGLVNVRVLELIDDSTGSRIELEGNRLPLTHSKDVIDHLR